MFNKSQTATEYLIILAVVVIISVITVGTLSDVIGLGGGMDEQTARLTLAAQTVAITEYAVSDYDIDLTLKNNHNNQIEIDEIWINNEQCLFFYGTVHRLNPGQTKDIVCQTVYELEDTSVQYPVVINWTDTSTGSTYTQSDSDAVIVGAVSNEYLSKIQSNDYWNESINGCYDNTTSNNPICTCVDLNKTRDNLDKDHTLQNSIDFNRCKEEFGVDFTESNGAGGWEPISFYRGTFEGDDNLISGLYVNQSEDKVGLFSVRSITDPVITIRNLGLVQVKVSGGLYTGAFIGDGQVGTVLQNVFAKGSVMSDSNYVGGLVGYRPTSISNSYFKGSVSGGLYTGGLLGVRASFSLIKDSFFDGVVSGDSYVGGLAGYFNGDIQNSYALGSVSATNTGSSGYAGGLVGGGDSVTISSSWSGIKLFASNSEAHGLVSYQWSGSASISNSYWVNYTTDGADECMGMQDVGSNCTAVSSINDIPIR